jgi:hypothetical protein
VNLHPYNENLPSKFLRMPPRIMPDSLQNVNIVSEWVNGVMQFIQRSIKKLTDQSIPKGSHVAKQLSYLQDKYVVHTDKALNFVSNSN